MSGFRFTTFPMGRSCRLMVGTTALIGLLAGCETFEGLNFPNLRANADGGAAPAAAAGGKTVERDVEAPEVFSATDQGLWDGRPSLGGVWVAHPDVTEPERVIIRNDQNGKFVIGALFRRERDLPGPKLQISSDAAAALNILAGAPAPLNVTALRREEAPEAPVTQTGEALDASAETAAAVAQPAEVTETALDPIAAASAAIEAAPQTSTPATAATPAPAPVPKPAAPVSNLSKPFVQIGIFSVKANADRTAKQMRSAGLTTSIKQGETSGKPFWRVVVGPAANRSQLNSLLKKVKAEGFSDAYAVTN